MNAWLGALLGVVLGSLAGLIPGFHVNTIAFAVALHAQTGDLGTLVLLVTATMTQSFVDWVPSLLLSAPEESTALAVLPGHRLLLAGKASQAVQEALNGTLLGTLIALSAAVAFVQFAAQHLDWIRSVTPWVLSSVIALGVLAERGNKKKAWALLLMASAGLFGYFALQWHSASIFPLMAGLFGSSQAVHSTLFPPKIPAQSSKSARTPLRLKAGLVGSAAGALVALLPSMSISQSMVVVRALTGKTSAQRFLFTAGSAIASSSVLGFFTLYAIGAARTGAAAAMQQLTTLQWHDMLWIGAALLWSAGTAYYVARCLAQAGLNALQRAPYRALNACVILFTALLSWWFVGWLGLGAWFCATSLGVACISSGVRRGHLMASLMFPTIAWYWRLG